jgi:hypothetical protein
MEANMAEVEMRQPPRLPDVRYGGWQGQAQQQQQQPDGPQGGR